jgi:hypothetical protein
MLLSIPWPVLFIFQVKVGREFYFDLSPEAAYSLGLVEVRKGVVAVILSGLLTDDQRPKVDIALENHKRTELLSPAPTLHFTPVTCQLSFNGVFRKLS